MRKTNHTRTFIALSILVFIMQSGCGIKHISLTKNVTDNIKSADAELYIPQKNIIISAGRTSTAGLGLIETLIVLGIDSIRNHSAEKKAAQITEELQNYDFRKIATDTLSERIKDIKTIKINNPIKLHTVYSESNARIAFDQSTACAVTFIIVDYRLESGNLIVRANVQMFPKSKVLFIYREKPNDSNPIHHENAIYRKTFEFIAHSVTKDSIEKSLTEGVFSIAEQIVADINHIQ